MDRSVLQVAAEAAKFDGGADYRKEKSAAVFDPSTMARPPRGGPPRGAASSVASVASEADWGGNPVYASSKKHFEQGQSSSLQEASDHFTARCHGCVTINVQCCAVHAS